MNTLRKRIAVVAVFAVLLCTAAVAAHAAAVLVPCVHWVPMHPGGDIVYNPDGAYFVVSCTHMVQLHPYDVIFWR